MSKVLGIGSTGEEVRNWKRYLVSQGFKLNETDRFDPATLAATRKMQKRLGVKADGKVGHRTLGRQAATQGTPLPQARPDMPPAPQPMADVLGGSRTGAEAFVSSGPEADLTSMGIAASNRKWADLLSGESVGRDTDMRAQQALMQGATGYHRLDPNIPIVPPQTWDVAHTPGEPPVPSSDFSGTGEPLSPMGAPAPTDPRTRDMMIRLLLQRAGG